MSIAAVTAGDRNHCGWAGGTRGVLSLTRLFCDGVADGNELGVQKELRQNRQNKRSCLGLSVPYLVTSPDCLSSLYI